MLQSFFSRLGRWSELPSSFEYTIGEEVVLPFVLACNFLLFNCRRKSDDMPASVFVLYKKQPPSTSCSCSSAGGGCCNNCVASGTAGAAASRAAAAVAASLAAGTDVVQQARQHMKRVKTLLHPDLLKMLQTYESDAAIYIVTERCWPLPLLPEWAAEGLHAAGGKSGTAIGDRKGEARRDAQVTSSTDYTGISGADRQRNSAAATSPEKSSATSAAASVEVETIAAAAAKADVAWGLLQVANAVAFLQDSCHLVHGQVSPLSIFVTADGSWKLSALELVRPFQQHKGGEAPSHQQQQSLQQLWEDQRRSAAYLQGWQPPDRMDTLVPLQWADWWGLASVLVWSYGTLAGHAAAGGRDSAHPSTSRGRGSKYSYSSNSYSSNSYSSRSYSSNSYSSSSYNSSSSSGTFSSGSYGSSYGRNLFDLSSATVRETAPHVPPLARQLLHQLLSPGGLSTQGGHHQPQQQHLRSNSSVQPRRLSDLLKQTPFFSSNSTCNCMLFLREVHVKGAYEKEVFFEKQLPGLLQPQQELCRESRQAGSQEQGLPLVVQQQQVLPELLKLLDPTCASGGANASCRTTLECTSGSLTPAIVGCVAIIASSMKPDEPSKNGRGFSTAVAAAADLQVQRLRIVLEKLFKSRDRALRYTLLTSLDDFEPLMTRDLCENTFNAVLLGVLDSTSVIREATIKALVVFCQKLATQKVLQTCLEQLRRLNEDAEVVLRTNACICAAKICSLPETVAMVSRSEKLQQLLAQILLAAMRDSFPLCRVASLQSVQHALSAFAIQTAMLTLTPAVAAAALDPELSVAEAAVCTLQKLGANAATATAERRAAIRPAETANVGGAAVDASGNLIDSGDLQIGGENSGSSTLTKAAVSVSSAAALNFGNGGWFGVVARRLRNSLGVAGVLSNSGPELQSTGADGTPESSGSSTAYGTSSRSSTHGSIGSCSTKPLSYSMNIPPPPPPAAAGASQGLAAAASDMRSPPSGSYSACSGNVVGVAEKRSDVVSEPRSASREVLAEGSVLDGPWHDATETLGPSNPAVVPGGSSSFPGTCAPFREAALTLSRGKDSNDFAVRGANAAASAARAIPASVDAAGGGERGSDMRTGQDVRNKAARSSTSFSTPAGATVGKPGVFPASAPSCSATAAPDVDDFFAEMERQLREEKY